MSIKDKILERIDESAGGYQGRIDTVSADVLRTLTGDPKRSVDDVIKMHGSQTLEARLGGKGWKDFVRDVKKNIAKEHGKLKASNTRVANATKLKQVYEKIGLIISTSIGNSFPDGDPIDTIHPKVIRVLYDNDIKDEHGNTYDRYDDISAVLDQGSKTQGYKSYHDQLKSTWDDFMADNPELKKSHPHNPW